MDGTGDVDEGVGSGRLGIFVCALFQDDGVGYVDFGVEVDGRHFVLMTLGFFKGTSCRM